MASLFLLFVFTFGPALCMATCGQRPVSGTRIVGGEEAVPHSWPWQLSLQMFGMHNCGASLITPQWAVTAAHCVQNNYWYYSLQAGSHLRQDDGVQLKIAKIIPHKGYSRSHLRHDIALIKLASPAKLSPTVNTVCLPKQGSLAKPGGNCYITGWGRILPNDFKKMAGKLQQSRVPVIDHKECRSKNGGKVDQSTMICIGGRGSSACNGDSGGPLVCEESGHWVLRGSSSWVTDRSCPGHSYSVYARVSSHVGWIKSEIGDGGTDSGSSGGNADCRDTHSWCVRYAKYCGTTASIRKSCKKTCNKC
ncbi:chymotrypsinogen B isoform X2 [Nematostella vectensis]|uniref:chymotrypsinogen B isoform X2 n=1 Tax=Nematostella vectensis TaxID=45351 RepID=UPI002076E9ED|nr:chymotrypsinogen B isoform X2 [Nematostella vectensis]